MTDEQFRRLLHPSEQSRYILALVTVTPLVIGGLALVFGTVGIALLAIPVILFFYWFVSGIARAIFLGSAVRVSELNFPEIYQALLEAKAELSYPGAVDVFIYPEGEVNAYLVPLFRRKFVLIPSGAVSGRLVAFDNQVKWLISCFIAALKSKHRRLFLLRLLINASEKLFVLNFLLYPYERAAQYTGDQVGLAVTGDLGAAVRVMTKFFVGKDIVDRVQVRGLIAQADEIHTSFFALLARLLSPFPHLTDRYLNLLAFARSSYPSAFTEYLSRVDDIARSEILGMLPNIHPALEASVQAKIEQNTRREE